MRYSKKWIALLCALLIAALFVPSAMAATKKPTLKALKTGTWITGRTDTQDSSGPIAYKLTLAKDSLVTFNWRKNSSDDLYINVYDNKLCREADLVEELRGHNQVTEKASASGTGYLPLSKGTYYIKLLSSGGKAQAKFATKALKAQSNYCLANATTMARNKAVTILDAAGDGFGHWYKITNPTTQKLKFVINWKVKGFSSIHVYNSKLVQGYDCLTSESSNATRTTTTYTTYSAVPAGTYYVFTSHNDEAKAAYYTLTWK